MEIDEGVNNLKKLSESAHRKKLLYRLQGDALDKMIEKLGSKEAQVAILDCIKACAENSERLSKDAKTISKPSASALLELAMEEACKASTLAIFYIGFYNVESARSIIKDYNVPMNHQINVIYTIFKDHEFKVLMPVLSAVIAAVGREVYSKVMPKHLKKRGVTGEKAKEIIDYANGLLESFATESIPSKIKEKGFYVDFDFNRLKVILPIEATRKDIEVIEAWTEVYLDLVKQFLGEVVP